MLHVPLHPDETAASFCSRTAAANGIGSATEFCRHFKIGFSGVASGTPSDLDALCTRTGLPPGALDLHSVREVQGRYLVRNHWFTRNFLETRHLRACPNCLQDDLETPYRSHYGCYQRIAWTIKFVRFCPIHDVALISPPTGAHLVGDFSRQVTAALKWIKRPHASERCGSPRPLETYALSRLNQQKSGMWLDDVPLQAALHFTELIGRVTKYGIDGEAANLSTVEQCELGNLGFAICREGLAAVRDCICDIAKRSPHLMARNPEGLFGNLMAEIWEMYEHPGYMGLLGVLQEIGIDEIARRFADRDRIGVMPIG